MPLTLQFYGGWVSDNLGNVFHRSALGEVRISIWLKNSERRKLRIYFQRLPTTPLDRPVREKKPVKTFDPSTIRDSSREFIIEQGKGTQLKNTPNVAYKLSKLTRGVEMTSLWKARKGLSF
ncbi:hypothetical protein SUGI_0069970 [Cryptomeria japonica]|nr:hypothetical protein SUGI_0069970 [Cryptomeria japonica]